MSLESGPSFPLAQSSPLERPQKAQDVPKRVTNGEPRDHAAGRPPPTEARSGAPPRGGTRSPTMWSGESPEALVPSTSGFAGRPRFRQRGRRPPHSRTGWYGTRGSTTCWRGWRSRPPSRCGRCETGMSRVPKLNANLVIIWHRGGTSSRNPYDQLTPQDRHKKILELCARVYLRVRSQQAAPSTRGSEPASSQTPAPAASDPRSGLEGGDDAR